MLTESRAIIDVREKRENEHISTNIQGHHTLDDTLSLVVEWIINYERPDIIQAKLIKILNNEITTKDNNKKAEIFLPIIEATDQFIRQYDAFWGITNNLYKERNSIAHQDYLNRQAEGLGFGIITTSVSNAALFTALDTYEKQKQLKKQETNIWSNMNSFSTGSIEVLYRKIKDLYENQYSKKIQKAIKKAFQNIEDNTE